MEEIVDTKVEALEGSQKKLTVTVDAEEIDKRIKKTYKDFASRYNFPGFRKGKAPRPVIDSMLGKEAVRAQVTDDVVNGLYPIAMDDNDLISIAQPDFDLSEELVTEHAPFTFTVTVKCRPEFELDSYDQVAVKLPSVEATDAEIDEQIDELRNYYYTFEDAADDAAIEENGFAEISLAATDDKGENIETISTDSRLYELGSGLFPEAFDAALEGLKKGDTTTVKMDVSDSLMGRGIEGDVTIDVEVKQVKTKVLPELNDEWAKETAGFEGGVEELRTRIADSIKQQKEQMMPRLRENEALYALQKRVLGEAPEELCSSEEQNLLQNFFQQIQQSGLTFDAYLAQMGMTPADFKDDVKKQAKDVTLQDLALDAWARHFDIQVSDEEISEEFKKSGVDDPAKLEKQWRENGQIASLRAGMKRTKAIDAIVADLAVEELKPGEKLQSVEDEEAEGKAAEAEAPKADETPAEAAAEGEKLTKTALNKLKVAELREKAEGMGIATDGLKKAELVDAILAAE
ncbi:MAG: trigger factor [Eggerthellaceae bacterium]|nr:trigger factor [Eggerthellaceae bacterium]